ncbi:spore cortex biosynthesis protein YabQ [Bengtsoniella intestinalis]|uniref:spore cortex biosynthesis protein YabQ n=1 Tax=Bengtsoniella intestinalis TaxID=3073143 RepID=UPI00391F7097
MEIYITEQARVFVLSVLLGIAIGGLYDMAGAVRGHWPRLTPMVDVTFGLSALGAVFLFILRQSQGQLRLFVLLGILGGCVLFFTGLSPLLRPVWGFWVETLVWLGRILALPAVIFGNLLKLFRNYLKKLFYFWQKCCTMKYHRLQRGSKGGMSHGESTRRTQTKSKS